MSFAQIARVFAVTLATAVAAGSLGSMVALWREKTFQALAMTVLGAGLLAGGRRDRGRRRVGRAVAGRLGRRCGPPASAPGRRSWSATRPLVEAQDALPYVGHAVNLFLLFALALTVAAQR